MTALRATIGLPVFNGEDHIVDCLNSLKGQDVDGVEILISDNASVDATEEICRDFAARDGRFFYERLAHNIGAAGNYNRLVHKARGDYFRWMAHDDIVEPEHLSRCLAVYDTRSGVALAYPQTRLIDVKGESLGLYDDGLSLEDDRVVARVQTFARNIALCNAVFGLIPMNILRTTRLIGPYMDSDRVLLLELLLRGRFVEIDSPLMKRRIHEGSSRAAEVTATDVAEWFAGSSRGRVGFERTHLVAEYLRAVLGAPLQPAERSMVAAGLLQVLVPQQWRVVAGEWKREALKPLRSSGHTLRRRNPRHAPARQ